jgi:hypothetical protein
VKAVVLGVASTTTTMAMTTLMMMALALSLMQTVARAMVMVPMSLLEAVLAVVAGALVVGPGWSVPDRRRYEEEHYW